MTEHSNPIAPRLRPGEVIPSVPDGKVPTRFHGEIVFVSARGEGDESYGNSPYTQTQVAELEGIRVAKTYLDDAIKQLDEFFSINLTRGDSGETVIEFSQGMHEYLDYGDLEEF